MISLFLQRVYKLNNTGARMLDSIYHITLKSILNYFLGGETLISCHIVRILAWGWSAMCASDIP